MFLCTFYVLHSYYDVMSNALVFYLIRKKSFFFSELPNCYFISGEIQML